MRINGACHCGNIGFVLDWRSEPGQIVARACDCTFCVKHGGVWTASASAALTVSIKDPARVSRYAFATRTADFQVCAVCGVVPLVLSRIDGRWYAVVNVNTFEDFDPALLQRSTVCLDGEDEARRLDRRQRNWIGEVEVLQGA